MISLEHPLNAVDAVWHSPTAQFDERSPEGQRRSRPKSTAQSSTGQPSNSQPSTAAPKDNPDQTTTDALPDGVGERINMEV